MEPTEPEAQPQIPPYNLNRIEQQREKLSTAIMDFVGTELETQQFAAFVEAVHAALPQGIPLATVQHSLLTSAGTQLTKGEAVRTAWRLAGNTGRLRKAVAVPPWTMQTEKEWVPLQIIEVLPGVNHKKERGFFVHKRILAGTPCPIRIMRFWTKRFASWMARNLGFTSRRRQKPGSEVFPYHTGVELTSLRFMGLLDPTLTRDGKPSYFKFACTTGLLEWNKQILRARNHTDPPCPFDYGHACHLCAVGYDQCLAGCHPTTWDWDRCPECNQDAWCDPDHPRRLCVDCMEQGR